MKKILILMMMVLAVGMTAKSAPVRSIRAARNSTVLNAEEIPYASEVEWIYVNGTAYCDTGLAFTPSSNYVMKLDMQFPDGWVVNGSFFGVIAGSNPYFSMRVGTSALRLVTYPTNQKVYVDPVDRNRHLITLDAINDTLTFDSNVQSLVYPISSFKSSNHIILFNHTKRLQDVKMRTYSLRIWNRDGALVKELVPYRVGIGADAVGCFFDKTNPNGGVNGDGLFPITTGTATIEIGPDKK